VSGYNVYQYRVIVEREGRALDPDLVLIGLCKNDIVGEEDIEILRELARTKLDYRNDRRVGLRRRAGLLHLLDGVVLRVQAAMGIRVPDALHYEGGPAIEARRRYSIATLAAVAEHTRSRGIPLLVAAFPTRTEAETGRITHPVEALAQVVEERGQYFLDMREAFDRHRGETLFLDPIHPNSRGNAIAADAILEALRERVIVR